MTGEQRVEVLSTVGAVPGWHYKPGRKGFKYERSRQSQSGDVLEQGRL